MYDVMMAFIESDAWTIVPGSIRTATNAAATSLVMAISL
jgi:hypothetical protein